MQGGKNRFLPKELNATGLVEVSSAGNLVNPLMFLYGTERRGSGAMDSEAEAALWFFQISSQRESQKNRSA
jgi:hypothetical protein